MNLTEIQDLIKFVAKQKVTEVEIEKKDFKITIKSEKEEVHIAHVAPQAPLQMAAPAAAAIAAAPSAPSAPASPAEEENANYITIKSPMIGTFYRSANPESDSFVNVGDTIKEGDVLCIVEAMKLFNEIEAEVSGKIVKVLTDDASPIEFDQPLFLVDPS
ncbi:acetyl-CoA carboxylase biotin carboxyl carrier protein [Flavobacteriales bacterium]|nr:acetyl-CoA carboxylase biotin carboxyl carrier protein [Flavobacteriales bacterium]MDA9775623.1 acetyl-CoA carboxylase biotin carboxyl carrier protein [Flavobacteriales bacterium]